MNHDSDLPKVSILMNCYNGEAYVKEALNSVINQSYTNHEVVFVDNCSTDRTAEIALAYRGKIKYVRTPHLMKLYEARNFGIEHLDGDFICFLDSDDVWESNKLVHQVKLMEKKELQFTYSNWKPFYTSARTFKNNIARILLMVHNALTKRLRSGYTKRTSLLKNYDINLQTVMVRKSCITGLNFDPNLNLYGDLDFFFRLFWERNVRPFYDSTNLVRYRIHENQLSRKSAYDWCHEGKYLLKKYRNTLNSRELISFEKFFISFHRYTVLLEEGKVLSGLWGKARFVFSSRIYVLHLIRMLAAVIGNRLRRG